MGLGFCYLIDLGFCYLIDLRFCYLAIQKKKSELKITITLFLIGEKFPWYWDPPTNHCKNNQGSSPRHINLLHTFVVLQILKLEMPRVLSMHQGPDETVNSSNLVLPWWAASATRTLAMPGRDSSSCSTVHLRLPPLAQSCAVAQCLINVTAAFTSALPQLCHFDAI